MQSYGKQDKRKRLNAKRGQRFKKKTIEQQQRQRRPSAAQRDRDAKGILPEPLACDVCLSPNIAYATYGTWRDTAAQAQGKPYEHNQLYGCEDCGARVGVHRNTNHPLGYMADAPTRRARANLKPLFNSTIKEVFAGDVSAAYIWLSRRMNLPKNRTHWGMFNIEQCLQAADICLAELFPTIDTKEP